MMDMMDIFYSFAIIPLIALAGIIIWFLWEWLKDIRRENEKKRKKEEERKRREKRR